MFRNLYGPATILAISAGSAQAQTAAMPANQLVVDVPTVAPPTVAGPKERIICRRDVEIGSFVKGVRRCGTASEWRKSEEAARYITDKIQEQKGRISGH